MSRQPSNWQESFLKLYRSLASHYGAAFLRGSEEDRRLDHISHWQRTLHEARITSEEMGLALHATTRAPRFRQFPPNPAELIGLVHWERAKRDHGIPEADLAYQQACGLTKEVHPLVRQVRSEFGGWFLRTHDASRTRTRFIELYTTAAEQLSRGERALDPESEVDVCDSGDRLASDEVTCRIDKLLSDFSP